MNPDGAKRQPDAVVSISESYKGMSWPLTIHEAITRPHTRAKDGPRPDLSVVILVVEEH